MENKTEWNLSTFTVALQLILDMPSGTSPQDILIEVAKLKTKAVESNENTRRI